MSKNSQKVAALAMLTGIVGVLFVAGWSGSSPQPAPVPPTQNVVLTPEPEPQDQNEVSPVASLTETQSVPSRVSVSFNDDASSTSALMKGVPPFEKSARYPDLDIWYGQYSDQDFRILPASPVEKEPSRLNVKLSFGF